VNHVGSFVVGMLSVFLFTMTMRPSRESWTRPSSWPWWMIVGIAAIFAWPTASPFSEADGFFGTYWCYGFGTMCLFLGISALVARLESK
jgi:hypothetical protein